MKNLLKLTALFFILFTFGCQEVEDQILQPPFKNLPSNLVENADNDQDEVGRIHNEALAFILSKRVANQKFTAEELTDILMEYQDGKKGGIDRKHLDIFIRKVIDKSSTKIGGMTFCQIYPEICDMFASGGPFLPSPNIPPFDAPVLTDDAVQNYANALAQVNTIKKAEAVAMEDPDMSDEQHNATFSYSSTYRYSTQFWHNAIDQGLIPNNQLDGVNKACNSCDIIAADAAGAYIGSWFGPLGAGIAGAAASLVAYDEIYN